MMERNGLPPRQGLYDPAFEHDACGIGMLVNIDGSKSHKLVSDAIDMLGRMDHRGGVGSEEDSGDGAGILLQLPHAFLGRVARSEGFALPESGAYGVAMLFASPDPDRGQKSVEDFCGIARAEGLSVLGVRTVPVCAAGIGRTAATVCPGIRQVFLQRPEGVEEDDFERRLYIVGKMAHKAIRCREREPDRYFYIASISCRTIVYKGMLLPCQLSAFYLDLKDEEVASAIALVHSRFSTNTFPSWERAHPIHHLCHNGEINTIRGNVNWVRAREKSLSSTRFGADLAKVLPAVDGEGSDSAMLDDFLSLLLHSGYSLPQAVMMTIPQPWEEDAALPADRRAFYEFHSCLVEPWDGPAAVAFTDGRVAGATLDRNGLRPARYYLTRGGTLILASEAGVLPVADGEIVQKDRLRPGRMLLIDTERGVLVEQTELDREMAAKPYRQWLDENLMELGDLPASEARGDTLRDILRRKREENASVPREQALLKNFAGIGPFVEDREDHAVTDLEEQKLFGYTWEDLTLTLKAMAETGEDPVSAMGTDTPLAVLSGRPQLLYNYFKQLFAQVTNPPIDAIREHLVTSSLIQLGSEGNLLEPGPESCRMIRHSTPILSDQELQTVAGASIDGFRSVTLPILFHTGRKNALRRALDDLFFAADIAIDGGYNILILSDRDADPAHAPIPALLATAGLHHHLIRKGTRTRASIVVETGEAREVHHLALLVGYGANAVNPWLAHKSIVGLCGQGLIQRDPETAQAAYRGAATKSIVKIMSKMGISTVRSYHGAQIFEALGIGEKVISQYFTGTTSRIGGLTLREIEQEVRDRHAAAFAPSHRDQPLDPGGDYKWRKHGEYHLFNPENIFYLQQACRTGNYEMFKTYTRQVNQRSTQIKNIRGLLNITYADKPIPLSMVESEDSIVRRFKTGAMSYGSISKEAHECMAVAMNRLGGRSNTGEGGENPERFAPDDSGDSRCSAIKQVASGRFGVTIHYLSNAKEIQIKMAQGAKPGEGGHLPGGKVYPWIAGARHSTPGVELISPPPHHDIYSIEDLAQLIHDLKCANPGARVSVKLVSEAGVGTIAVGVAKGLADVIVVSGYDGGTGAAPRTSIRHAGLPWELGVAEAHQTLLLNNLRNRVVLETDGKLLTGRDIVIAALLGAEEFAFATAPLVVMGCDMMRVCNLDTCPAGIATQNPALRARFAGKPEHVENLMRFLAREVREIMARIGVGSFDELVGRVELLRERPVKMITDKAHTVDLSSLLYQPKAVDSAGERYFTHPQDHRLEKTMDASTLVPLCRPAIEGGGKVSYRLPVDNRDRTVGCLLSGEVVRAHGPQGLPDDTIHLRMDGSAGQSFGAFLAPGITLDLHGDANDYIGKGLSGGRIIVRVPEGSAREPGENIIVGNVALYGATAGEAYFQGLAGERFCVRGSGVSAVVEGVGAHGCEYMTGGRVAILGPVGRNFAAGMSGGVAYVLDENKELEGNIASGSLALCALSDKDRQELRTMLENHHRYTGSAKAARLLEDFDRHAAAFVKVIPRDYRRVLEAIEEAGRRQVPEEERMLFAFNTVVGAASGK